MFSTGFKGVGLHYTAFAGAICGDSRPTAASRGVSRRKKFAVEANVESRVKQIKQEVTLSAAANASENLDKIVVFRCDQPTQQFSSFDVHSYCNVLNFMGKSINQEAASCFVDISNEQEVVYHICRLRATANIFHFPRHILCPKHEYMVESMEKKDTETESNDESFDFHLDPNRVRTNAEIQLFADVFSISIDEARQILKKEGRQCQS